MSYPEESPFEAALIEVEIEYVTRELCVLDEAESSCRENNHHLAADIMKRNKFRLLTNPDAQMTRDATSAHETWEHFPAIAKFIYQENDND